MFTGRTETVSCLKRLPSPTCQPLFGTASLENKVQAPDLAWSAHQPLSCCHLIMLLTTTEADSILSAAANYDMGILSAVAN